MKTRSYRSHLLAAMTLVAFCTNSHSQTTIATEDFDGGTPAWTNDIASQTFVDPSSPGEGLFIQASTNIGSGNTALGQDLGGESGEPTLSPYTFTFDPIAVSPGTNYEVSFDYYAFANADAGSYEIFIDGTGQGAVEWYNDPDTTPVQGTISVPVSGASTIGLELTGTLNGGSDVIELDNFQIVEAVSDGTPPGLDAGVGTSPSDDATDVLRNPVISLPFDEAVQADIGNINIRLEADDSLVAAFDVTEDLTFSEGSTLVSFMPEVFLDASTSYYIEIESGALTDASGNATTALSTPTDLNFTTGTDATFFSEAVGSINIETDGPAETDAFYAQNAGGNFDEYGMAEFSISPADLKGVSLDSISSLTLSLTVNDRFFSAQGDYFILFTADGKTDLSDLADYDTLAFDGTSAYGINAAEFSSNPVVVTAAQNYPFDGENGEGTEETVSINLSSIETALLNAINSGENFHFLIGAPSTGGGVATFSGFGNTFDPGAPALTITGTPGAPVAALAITESGGSTDVEEGGATDSFDVALNSTPTADVDVVLTPDGELDLGNGAGNPFTLTFTAADATTIQTVTVSAFDDSDQESLHTGVITVTTTTTDPEYNSISSSVTANISDNDTPVSLLITQYYESDGGSSKYIELTNVSDSPVDLTDYTLTRWRNETAEDYKISGGSPATLDLTPLGTIQPGETKIVADGDATSPISAAEADLTQTWLEGGAVSFNGNDSVVIYASTTIDPSNIVDAIGFTNGGNEGADKSFVRISTAPGYDLTSGSNATSPQFSSVWTEVPSLDDVDNASFGDDKFLGSSALAGVSIVSFAARSQTVAEVDGSFDLDVTVTGLDEGSVTVDVAFDGGTSTADSSDITFTSPTQLTFSANETQTITVPIIDDGLDGATEQASFTLAVSSGAAILGTSTQDVYIQDSDLVPPNLILSEIVDPGDDFNGRYVEIYNPTGSSVDLSANNWNLVRFTNGGTSGSVIALTGTIGPDQTYIVAFTDVSGPYHNGLYGTNADQESSQITGNGDDVYALYTSGDDSNGGVLQDVYGVIGVVGTGEPWAYENRRAVRNAEINQPSGVWTESEWTIESADVADATPGIHPESDVPAPTGVTATALSESEVEVAFTPAGSDDVLILFNQTGSFTNPSGTPPAVGQPFAGGTVLSLGTTSPTLHSGLASETEYFYALYTFDGTDYSNVVQVSATTPIAGLINSEDFSGTPDWFNESVEGDDPWGFTENDAFIDGATTTEGLAEKHYLISPALDFSSAVDLLMNFDYAGAFDVDGIENLELLYSTNYAGSGDPEASGVAWTNIAFDFTNINSGGTISLQNSGDIALPEAIEELGGVHLAFRYTADGTLDGSEQWIIDNISVQGSDSTPNTDPLADYLSDREIDPADLLIDTDGNGLTVLEEYAFGIGDGEGADLARLGADPATNALTLLSDLETDPAGVTVELLATSDLTAGFSVVAFTTSSVDNGDGTFTRSYTETNPPAQSDSRFYQLQITVEAQ